MPCKIRAVKTNNTSWLRCSMHFHNEIELLFVLKGNISAFVEAESYFVSAGEIFVVFPNQIHRYSETLNSEYMLLHLPAKLLTEYGAHTALQAPDNPVISLQKCRSAIKGTIESLYISVFRFPSTHIRAEADKRNLIAEILHLITLKNRQTDADGILYAALSCCRRSYSRYDFTLQQISDELNKSKYTLSRILSKKLNMSFPNLINSIRIDEACRMFSENKRLRVSEVSEAVGFGSVRSFNRAFFRFRAQTPKTFIKKLSNVSANPFGR